MKLTDLTLTQLKRLYRKAYARMSCGDGYQPYGYDWRTLKITRPGWHTTLRAILLAINNSTQPTTAD